MSPIERWDWLLEESSMFKELDDFRISLVYAGRHQRATLIEWWQWEIVDLHNRLDNE